MASHTQNATATKRLDHIGKSEKKVKGKGQIRKYLQKKIGESPNLALGSHQDLQ